MRKKTSNSCLRMPFVVVACLAFITSITGCGDSKLADVRGVVTLDGKPLPDAFVKFLPTGDGASSAGKTDADGSYRMRFTDTAFGAFIGENRVSISTGDVKADNSGRIPELVPNTYNSKTELVESVKAGKNTINFDLKSDTGKIDQVKYE